MKLSIIEKYGRLAIAKKVASRGLLITSAILGTIGALTYYGSKVGNFVIGVDGDDFASISLSETEDLSDLTDRLIVETMPDILDADFSYIPENIEEGLGSKNDKSKRYLAYSFYLVNSGSIDVNYKLSFSISRVTRNIDSILRIMIIRNGEYEVYAKAREQKGYVGDPEPIVSTFKDNIIGYTIPFLEDNNGVVIEEIYTDLQIGTKDKFTFVMWVDGWDSEQIDDMQGGALQTSVDFDIL